MPDGVTWIDDIELAIEGSVILAVATSGRQRKGYRMGRAAYREYIERAIRLLNEADEADRCQILPWPKTG